MTGILIRKIKDSLKIDMQEEHHTRKKKKEIHYALESERVIIHVRMVFFHDSAAFSTPCSCKQPQETSQVPQARLEYCCLW